MKACSAALRGKNFQVIELDAGRDVVQRLSELRPDGGFNALHGRFGEDGYIQALLEATKVKYTHSGVLASYIAMDKEVSKKIFLKNRITTPKYLKYKFNKKI